MLRAGFGHVANVAIDVRICASLCSGRPADHPTACLHVFELVCCSMADFLFGCMIMCSICRRDKVEHVRLSVAAGSTCVVAARRRL
jgi:hypothetical protein